ncbi:hypothetical protein F4810DRAFT_492193 [Camillea tinctor]|nr:hypothetical protein F4810DRAFT_492193 [Camillea tinctor]
MEELAVEILVHIAAPSKTVDDAKYRSLASAYIDFEPVTRLSFSEPTPEPTFESAPEPASAPICVPPSSSSPNRLLDTQGNSFGHDDHHENHENHETPRPSDPLGSLKSPYASWRSVIDNANSPLLRLGDRHVNVEEAKPLPPTQSTQSSSWQSPPSVVGDSQYTAAVAVAALSSPTRVLEHYLQSFADSSQPHIRSSNGSGPVVISNTPARPDNAGPKTWHQAQQWPSTPSVPNTPLGENTTITSDQKDKESHEGRPADDIRKPRLGDNSDDPDIIEASILSLSPRPRRTTRADSEPTAAAPPAADAPQALLRTTSDLGPRAPSPQPKSSVRIHFLPSHGFTHESLVLSSPEPAPSSAHLEPSDLLTWSLSDLARDLDLASRYRPRAQARALRPLERGYWAVDCGSWDAQLKRDAWAYLANYVGTGLAGWGVSCRRDAGYARLRLYCWGVVVPHLYLLLYLASQREILFTDGCEWVDGGGETVVVMGARERP